MSSRPNILFFLTDQHSPLISGFAGDYTVSTPNLDRLSKEGVKFTNAYCQNPVCAPSRASLLSGRYSKDIGIYDNQHILDSNGITFPRVLSESGYHTCVIGKTHYNGEQFQGYQERPYGDLLGQAHQPDPDRSPGKGPAGLGNLLRASGPSRIPIAMTQTEICVAEASKWLQIHAGSRGEQPFCLSVHFDKPHFPICPPEKYFNKYLGKVKLPEVEEGSFENEVPFVKAAMRNFGVTDPERKQRSLHEKTLAAYYGCVEWVDDALGRILETLDYLGMAENTIVVYASDHGEMAGARGTWQKSVFFDPSARVPLLVRWPKGAQAGTTVSDLVGLIDMFPTFCEAAGLEVPENCQGESLVPLLLGEKALERDAIFSESVVLNEPEHAGCMIRTGRWKYNMYLDGSEELYDLEYDPKEWRNLANDASVRSVRDELKNRVETFWEPEKQRQRYDEHPKMGRQKHFYPYSNQFVVGGAVVDARP